MEETKGFRKELEEAFLENKKEDYALTEEDSELIEEKAAVIKNIIEKSILDKKSLLRKTQKKLKDNVKAALNDSFSINTYGETLIEIQGIENDIETLEKKMEERF